MRRRPAETSGVRDERSSVFRPLLKSRWRNRRFTSDSGHMTGRSHREALSSGMRAAMRCSSDINSWNDRRSTADTSELQQQVRACRDHARNDEG